MAKRRKEKDEEDDKPFKIPKFDKDEYINRERRNIKSTIIAFLFGVLMSIICFGFWALMEGDTDLRWPLVILVALASASFIKYIYLKINLDTSDFTKKNWFSSYAIYLFTWLIIFIVLVNPPFYDTQDPLVDIVVLPEMQEYDGTVKIFAKITDNTDISKSNIDFTIDEEEVPAENYKYENYIFEYIHECPKNLTEEVTYNFELKAVDTNGRSTTKQGSFSFSNDTIILAEPDNYAQIDVNNNIRFKVDTAVNRVYYVIDEEVELNATAGERENYWVTHPEYEGWPDEYNKTIKIDVKGELVYYFKNCPIRFNNTITNNESYYFTIEDPDDIGEKTPVEVSMPKPKYVEVPGFETIIFILSIIAVVFILKYKKKDKKNKK